MLQRCLPKSKAWAVQAEPPSHFQVLAVTPRASFKKIDTQEVATTVLRPESSTTSQSDARFPGSVVSQQGYRSLPQPFWTFSSNSLGKFTTLFPDFRNPYLGLEGEFTENHLAVETPEAGASAHAAPPKRPLISDPQLRSCPRNRPAQGLSQLSPGRGWQPTGAAQRLSARAG